MNVESVDTEMRALSWDAVRRFMAAAAVMSAAIQDADRALRRADPGERR